MICPRCDSDTAHKLVDAPVNKAWEVFLCDTCFYSWRSTDPKELSDPKTYSKKFKIDVANIPKLAVIPPIPPLEKK